MNSGSLQVNSQPGWIGAVPCHCHLSHEPGELAKWLSHDDGTVKWSAQVQYNCNTRIFSCIAVVLHLHGPLQYNTAIQLQYNTAIQVFYNSQKTCRLLAAVVKKLVLQLYCACADCCNTTKFLCYVIVVVLYCIALMRTA